MARKKKTNFNNPYELQVDTGNSYFVYYRNYLHSLAYQLFEWENLPETVDPRYLEMALHQKGHVGFYKHPIYDFIAIDGAIGGEMNLYYQPIQFHGIAPMVGRVDFNIYHYLHMEGRTNDGVVIWNNDNRRNTILDLNMYARDLAELKEIIQVNQNAQKTPFIIETDDDTKLTAINVHSQIEGNARSILVNKNFNAGESIKVHQTTAPYVVDKLNTQKNAVWNECMTYLGINNANLEKRERMITSEAESNNEQVTNSGNVFLKARLEACERINKLYGLNVSVKYREDIEEALLEEGENLDG